MKLSSHEEYGLRCLLQMARQADRSGARLTVLIHIVHTVSHIADGKTGQLSSATDQ